MVDGGRVYQDGDSSGDGYVKNRPRVVVSQSGTYCIRRRDSSETVVSRVDCENLFFFNISGLPLFFIFYLFSSRDEKEVRKIKSIELLRKAAEDEHHDGITSPMDAAQATGACREEAPVVSANSTTNAAVHPVVSANSNAAVHYGSVTASSASEKLEGVTAKTSWLMYESDTHFFS